MKRGQTTPVAIIMFLVVLLTWGITAPMRTVAYSLAINESGAGSMTATIMPFFEPILTLAILAGFFIYIFPQRTGRI